MTWALTRPSLASLVRRNRASSAFVADSPDSRGGGDRAANALSGDVPVTAIMTLVTPSLSSDCLAGGHQAADPEAGRRGGGDFPAGGARACAGDVLDQPTRNVRAIRDWTAGALGPVTRQPRT